MITFNSKRDCSDWYLKYTQLWKTYIYVYLTIRMLKIKMFIPTISKWRHPLNNIENAADRNSRWVVYTTSNINFSFSTMIPMTENLHNKKNFRICSGNNLSENVFVSNQNLILSVFNVHPQKNLIHEKSQKATIICVVRWF